MRQLMTILMLVMLTLPLMASDYDNEANSRMEIEHIWTKSYGFSASSSTVVLLGQKVYDSFTAKSDIITTKADTILIMAEVISDSVRQTKTYALDTASGVIFEARFQHLSPNHFADTSTWDSWTSLAARTRAEGNMVYGAEIKPGLHQVYGRIYLKAGHLWETAQDVKIRFYIIRKWRTN